MADYKPRRPRQRCTQCFRLVGVSRHNVILYHKDPNGKRCIGIGTYGLEVR